MHKTRHIRLHLAIVLIFLFPALGTSATQEKVDKAIYEKSYEDVKTRFDDMKSKVDYVADNMTKFQEAMDTWRRATTREAQKKGIAGIDDLLDNLNEDAIKKLIETGLGESAVKQLEEIEKTLGIKLSDHLNLWSLFKKDPRKAFDYMYNLSASERYFRKSGVLDKVKAAQAYMKKGSSYLKNAGDMVEFVTLFDPTRTDEDAPTASLKRIKGVLEYSKKFTDKIPALGSLIDFYAEACDAFVGALDRLDKKLKEARQGALCGQLGIEKTMQKAFEADCGGCDCLTFLSMDDANPRLKPIRAWEGVESGSVFMYMDNTRHTVLDGASFHTLYTYYTALASSDMDANRGFAKPETLISFAMGIARSIAGHDKKFREYHRIVDGEKSYSFRKILEAQGVTKNHRLTSADRATYQLSSGKAAEFAALCFFSNDFRKLVQDIIARYEGLVPVSGTVTVMSPDADDALTGLKIWIDGQPADNIQCAKNTCQFSAVVKKNQAFGIRVQAAGFRAFSKSGYIANDLYDSIPPITLVKDAPKTPLSVHIDGPSQVKKRDTASLSLVFDGDGKPPGALIIRWFDVDTNRLLGKGDRIDVTPETTGTHHVRAVVWTKAGKGQKRLAQTDHALAVIKTPDAGDEETPPGGGPKDAPTGEPKPGTPKDKGPEKTDIPPENPPKNKNGESSQAGKDQDDGSGDSDATASSGTTVSDPVVPGKMDFAGTAPDIWKGGNSERGLHLKRTEASTPGNSKLCPNKATVFGELWAKINPSFGPRSPAELEKKLRAEVDEHKRWGRKATIRPFAVSSFKGLIVDTQVKFRSGAWSADGGYRGCSSSAYGHGFAMLDYKCIEVQYNIGGAGCFNNSHRPFLEAQTAAAQAEAKSILTGLQLIENGTIAKAPYTGPKLDGSDTPRVTLAPSDVETLKAGAKATVRAVVENAKPEDAPYTYTWSGDVEGQGDTGALKTEKPGKLKASVTVDGARYSLGSATLEFEVAGFTVTIERIKGDGPVPVGGTAALKATLLSGGKPASGNYLYRWQPHPEVGFKDLDSAESTTVATFTRTGKTGVWVQVLEQKGDTLATVAESDPIDIEVILPTLALAASPEKPYVGQAVKLKVDVSPAMDDKTVAFWWEIAGNALEAGALAKDREYALTPKDTRPVTVTVHAKTKDGGEELGQASLAVTALEYDIKVSEPRPLGPKPRIWKEGVGLVEAPNGIAVFQDVFVRATVTPAPAGSPARYRWSVTPEGCVLASPFSQETRAQASRTGSFDVAVAVTDARGILLGTGRGRIPVTISQEQMKGGKNREKAAEKLKKAQADWEAGNIEKAVASLNEAKTLAPGDPDVKRAVKAYTEKTKRIETRMKEAREKARIGKLDEALALAGEALAENPKNRAVTAYIERVNTAKADIDRKLLEVERLIQASEFLQAQNALIPLKNAYGYYPPIQAMDVRLAGAWRDWDSRVNTAIGNVRLSTENRDFKEALALIDEIRKTLKLLPSHMKTLSEQETYCKGLEALKEKARQLFASGRAKLAACDYDGAIRDFREGFQMSANLWNVNTDPTPGEAGKLQAEAVTRKKKLDGHMQVVQGALLQAPDPGRINMFENALNHCGEARTLQPDNPKINEYRAALEEKLAEARRGAGKTTPASPAKPTTPPATSMTASKPPGSPQATSAPNAAAAPLNATAPSPAANGVDISGAWTVMGSYDIRFSPVGTGYSARLLTVTPGMAKIGFRAGDEVMRVNRVSAHVFKGDYMKRESRGKIFREPCTIGVDEDKLYMGQPTERDPTEGMTYARRKALGNPTAASVPKSSTAGSVKTAGDITGTWRDNSAGGEWTFQPSGTGRYQAMFKGDVSGSGTATTNGNRITIDITIDGIKVRYDLTLSANGTQATGKWQSSDGDTENAELIKLN